MPSARQLQIGRTPNGYVLRLDGRGTVQVSAALFEIMDRLWTEATAEGGPVQMVIDLSACDYLDSTMLGCLVRLHRKMNSAETTCFRIATPHHARSALFGATRLETFFVFTQRVPVPFEDFVPIEEIRLDSLQVGQHMVSAHQALAETVTEGADIFERIAARLADELARKAAGKAQRPEGEDGVRTDFTEALS